MPTNTTARRLAPEDISPRTYVVILAEVSEFLYRACLTDDFSMLRAEFMSERPEPLEVISVCLPLVMVRRPNGKAQLIDVRRHRLARVDPRFAKGAVRALRGPRKKAKSAKP